MVVNIIVRRWSEALHGMAGGRGIHFGGQVGRYIDIIVYQLTFHYQHQCV